MENPGTGSEKREFSCSLCHGRILIPRELPPTTAPCPLCGGMITSPPLVVQDVPATHAEEIVAKPVKKDWQAPLVILLMLVVISAGAAFFAMKEIRREKTTTAANPPAKEDNTIREANYIRIGWQKDAAEVLRGFLAAREWKDKLPFILNGQALADRVRDFYGYEIIDESDTPLEGFAIHELKETDRKRGLFMMIYDRPPQIDMREFFRPLATLEVQHEIEEADLMFSTFARVSNFDMDALRVHAFFKRTPEGLKLDWELYIQTKYRTLRSFIEQPAPGRNGVFRVQIKEDVSHRQHDETGYRTYLIKDPVHESDSVRVNVKVDSDLGRTLSVINWRGMNGKLPMKRSATVELGWTGDEAAPELEIKRFICWEFLGLGGTAIN